MQATTGGAFPNQMLARSGVLVRLRSAPCLISASDSCPLLRIAGCNANKSACNGKARVDLWRCHLGGSCHGSRLSPTSWAPQSGTVSCARCFSSLRRKEAIGLGHHLNAGRVLPHGAPSTYTDAAGSLPTRSLPYRAMTPKDLDASDRGASISGSNSRDALQHVPPIGPPTDPPRQIEAGDADAAGRDMSRSPQALVQYLDSYIVGQADAKRAVAVALRQRWRRRQVGWAALLEIGATCWMGSSTQGRRRLLAKLSANSADGCRRDISGSHHMLVEYSTS